jgi:hypothetical protein
MTNIIKLNVNDKAKFCKRTAKYLSGFLNQEIKFIDVLDELSLYEWRLKPNNEILSKYVIQCLENSTINK